MFTRRAPPPPTPNSWVLMSFRRLGVDAGPFQLCDRCRGVCVQFGTVEARAYISGKASWRVDSCGMGAGLQRKRVPGFRGVKRSPTGTGVLTVGAFRDLQSNMIWGPQVGQLYFQSRLINFFFE